MINEIKQQKNQVNPEQNIRSSKAPSAQAPKPYVPAPSVPRSAVSLAAAAGLPADKLSASIVSFARFFSLPLKPQILANIRSQAFVQQNPLQQPLLQQPSQTAQPASYREVFSSSTFTASLAASAAESKGVELTIKGLELYAQAIDPDKENSHDGERQHKQQNREQNEQDLNAENIKKMALENAENNPLLEIMNRLPGKGGQRWIVFPLDFSKDDKDFKVSMRILLNENKISNRATCMALDVSQDKDKRWVFVMDSANEKLTRLTIYHHHELQADNISSLKNELSGFLEIPAEHIFIKQNTSHFPYEASHADNISLIDEAV